jgi:choline kinase
VNVNKAIILAAGKSKRLGALTENMPKCLLPLGSKTILEHQIENLRLNGISDITIVTGFCEEMIRKSCGSSFRYVSNPVFDKTNSIYSLWLALKQIQDGVIVLNSDVVFHPDILAELTGSPYHDALTVSFQDDMGAEEMKVKVKEGKIYDISKGIDPDEADGENVGIVKFSAEGVKVLFKKVDELVKQGVVNAWAPLVFQKICLYHDLYCVSTEGLPWIEIDFPEDLEKARKEIYPAICNSLSSGDCK